MPLTKDLLRILRTDIDAALVEVGKKHNVSLKLGNGTFLPDTATFKLEVMTIGEGGVIVTKELSALRALAPSLGLKPEHLDQVFKIGATNYTLVGYRNTGAGKPFIAKSLSDEKCYLVGREVIRKALGIADEFEGIREIQFVPPPRR